MNVTIGITTSFIVGGLLLVALLHLNNRMMQNSADVTANQLVKQKVQTVRQFVEHDFQKAGYLKGGEIGYNSSVLKAEPEKFQFQADLNQDGTAETITWWYDTSSPVTETRNPNDYILKRTYAGNTTEIKQGITSFGLKYYTNDGVRIYTPDDSDASLDSLKHVRKIQVSLICQSAESIDRNRATNSTTYAQSFWQSTITPWNLQQ